MTKGLKTTQILRLKKQINRTDFNSENKIMCLLNFLFVAVECFISQKQKTKSN